MPSLPRRQPSLEETRTRSKVGILGPRGSSRPRAPHENSRYRFTTGFRTRSEPILKRPRSRSFWVWDLLQRGNLLEEQPGKLRGDFGDQNTRLSQTLHLSICSSFRSGYDRPGVAHPLSGGSSSTGDVSGDPFRIFRIANVGCGVLFSQDRLTGQSRYESTMRRSRRSGSRFSRQARPCRA